MAMAMALASHRSASLSPSLPLKSHLTPLAFQLHARNRHSAPQRNPTTSSTTSSAATTQESVTPQPNSSRKPLSQKQKDFLTSALRVNHAGELAATLIYTAQTPPILKSHPHLRPLMYHMHSQEAGHFSIFNTLLAKHRIRPTAMYPVWYALATGLGWATGVMGREASMACTEAVETEIGEHYNTQVRELLEWVKCAEQRGEDMGEELTGLLGEIRRIRDEELEHLDSSVGEGAKEAIPYELLTGVIRAGCRGAIWVSERV